MAEKILAEIFILALPLVVFSAHGIFPGNKITPYFIPRILADRQYPKAELRRAGAAYCVFALWLFLLAGITSFSFMPALERVPLLLAVFFFVLPLLFAVSLVIGASYLVSGLFGRGDTAKPRLESMGDAQKTDLPKYIRKIKTYNIVNLSCPPLLAVLILTEKALGVAEKGAAILLNVSLLVTFIMTLWRIRAYLVKSAKVMDLSANKILLSTLFSPLGVFFVWFHSILLIRKFELQKRLEEKD